MAKLKVFRTPIGFHDAYVAAPSRKAALAAWGADADLFARGMAEEVTDPRLTAAALEQPGQVIRRARGTAAEHLAALPKDRPRKPAAGKDTTTGSTRAPSRSAKPKPRPSRAKLDALEEEVSALEARQRDELQALKAEQAELDKRRAAVERGHAEARDALARRIDRAKQSHQRAIEKWRADT